MSDHHHKATETLPNSFLAPFAQSILHQLLEFGLLATDHNLSAAAAADDAYFHTRYQCRRVVSCMALVQASVVTVVMILHVLLHMKMLFA
jgi:hypothetical protein